MPDIDMALALVEVVDTSNIEVDSVMALIEYTGNTLPPSLLLIESMDAVTAPTLPAGWTMTQVVTGGTNGAWTTSTTQKQVAPNSAKFNSSVATNGNKTRLWSPAYDFTLGPQLPQLNFYMYHDTGNSSKTDNIQVQISTDGGTNWTNVGSAYQRYAASAGWVLNTIDLSAYAANAAVNIGFLATSNVGGDMYIDTISILSTAHDLQIDMALALIEIAAGSNLNVDMVQALVEIVYGSGGGSTVGPGVSISPGGGIG